MIDIESIISNFSADERSNFIGYLKFKNKRHDTKNIQLFKLLIEKNTSKEISKKLYRDEKNSAYHALR